MNELEMGPVDFFLPWFAATTGLSSFSSHFNFQAEFREWNENGSKVEAFGFIENKEKVKERYN
jgi:hypothetical protein